MNFVKLKVSFCLLNLVIATFTVATEKDRTTYLQSTQDPINSLLPMLGGLLVIVVFIFFLAYLFKRFSNLNSGARLINIVESYAIGHKEKLAIIRVKDECFLIGITSNSINSIGKLNSTIIDEAVNSNEIQSNDNAGFAPIIAKLMSGKMTTEMITKKQQAAKENAL